MTNPRRRGKGCPSGQIFDPVTEECVDPVFDSNPRDPWEPVASSPDSGEIRSFKRRLKGLGIKSRVSKERGEYVLWARGHDAERARIVGIEDEPGQPKSSAEVERRWRRISQSEARKRRRMETGRPRAYRRHERVARFRRAEERKKAAGILRNPEVWAEGTTFDGRVVKSPIFKYPEGKSRWTPAAMRARKKLFRWIRKHGGGSYQIHHKQNPIPDWMKDESQFVRKFGYSLDEFVRMLSKLSEEDQQYVHDQIKGTIPTSVVRWVIARHREKLRVNPRSRGLRRVGRRGGRERVYYVARYRPAYPQKGEKWAVRTDIDSLPPTVVGKVAVVQARSAEAALREGRKSV